MKKIISLVLGISFLVQPIINVGATVSTAEELIVIGDTNVTETISNILKMDDDDDALKNVKSNLKSKNSSNDIRIQEDISNISDEDYVVFAYNDIKANSQYIDFARAALNDGAKVYIYGEISTEEYANLLDIKGLNVKMNVNDKLDDVYIGYIEDAEKELEDIVYDIIGYRLNSDDDKLSLYNIDVTNENGEEIKPSKEVYIRTILEDFYEIKNNNGKIIRDVTNPGSSTGVESNARLKAIAYYNNTEKAGTVYGSYKLFKANNETDANYDYFSIVNMGDVESAGTGNWKIKKYWVDLDIPYTKDILDDWGPRGNQSNSSFSFGFSYPWGISFSFTAGNRISISDISDRTLDYARWEMSYPGNKITFDPAAAWRSTGTLASLDIRQRGTFSDYRKVADTELKTSIRYDY